MYFVAHDPIVNTFEEMLIIVYIRVFTWLKSIYRALFLYFKMYLFILQWYLFLFFMKFYTPIQLLQNIGYIPCDIQCIHVDYLTLSSSYLSLLTPVMTLSSSSLVTSSWLYVCLILSVIFTSLIFVHGIRKDHSCILKILHISDILQYMSFSA